MIKHYILLVSLILFFRCGLNSQTVKNYYEYINQAEQYYYSNNLEKALFSYQQAFNIKGAPNFATDIFNFGYLCLSKGLFDNAYKAFKDVISLGYSCYQFKERKDSVFQAFFKTSLGIKLLKECDTISLNKNIDRKLRERIYNLVKMDQKFRLLKNGHTTFRDSIIKYDHIIVDSLLQIFKECDGIPSEKIIGIDSIAINNPIYFILIFHQSEGMFSWKFDYTNYILKAVENGSLNHRVAAHLLEKANSKFDLGEQNFVVIEYDSVGISTNLNEDSYLNLPKDKYCVGFASKSDSTIFEINRRRSTLYLPSLEHQTKVVEAHVLKKNTNLPLFFFVVSHYRISTKKEFDHWCSQIIKQ